MGPRSLVSSVTQAVVSSSFKPDNKNSLPLISQFYLEAVCNLTQLSFVHALCSIPALKDCIRRMVFSLSLIELAQFV